MADERKTILAGSGSLAKAARSVDCAAATFAQADRARRELGIDDAAQARRIIAPTMEKAEKPPFRFLGLSLQSSCETRALARIRYFLKSDSMLLKPSLNALGAMTRPPFSFTLS